MRESSRQRHAMPALAASWTVQAEWHREEPMMGGATSDIDSHAKPASGHLRWGSLIAVTLLAFALAACITVLEMTTRAQMDLGGFGASGGPYEIAHPLPEWSWLWPVSFVGIWIFAAAHAVFAYRLRGFSLILPTWCALFIWAGVTFLQYGIDPPGDGGVAWGWLVCALVFLPMGVLPVVLLFPDSKANLLHVDLLPSSRMRPEATRGLRRAYYVVHVVAIAGGVAAGWALFHAIAG
jgi:hypothetical protein